MYEYNLDKITKFYKKVAKRGGSKIMSREQAIKIFMANIEIDIPRNKVI